MPHGQISLITRDRNGYADGDVLLAINQRRRLQCHAEMICWPRLNGRKLGGRLGNTAPLLEGWFSATQQYRWERVSATELKRTNLWTGTEVVYGTQPVEDPDRPGRMIHCNVPLLLKLNPKLPLFGASGSERFYVGDGRCDYSQQRIDQVWEKIAQQTSHRPEDFPSWPFSERSLKSNLVIDVDDFDDTESEALVSPLLDDTDPENPVKLAKRSRRCNWRQIADVKEADVLDSDKVSDYRGRVQQRSGLVVVKQRPEKGGR